MKILLIHNNYGAYSGEESVVDKQITLFQRMGLQVSVYRKTTEGFRDTVCGNIKGLLQGFYSSQSVKDIKQIIKTNKPDVVVIHNLYPFISPAILFQIKKANVPIVMTVHNFRLICPTGLFMRNSLPCELCLGRHEWNCVKYNCENSYLKSLGYAGRNWYARVTKAYLNNVDIYVCITQFQIQKLIQAGFDKSKMRHIPNFLEKIEEPTYSLGDYVAISGRLSKEKGIDLALQVATKTPHIKYVFAGSPRKEEPITIPIPDNCIFLGHISKAELADFYQNARFLLNMSRCYEGFPVTILEAASYGKPSIGPCHAGFLEIIDNDITGLHFIPGDLINLQDKIEKLWDAPDACMEMGRQAFKKLGENYTAHVIEEHWKQVFKTVTQSSLLLIHNNYGIYSGEEAVVDWQIALFQQMGYQVSVYRKTTEGFRGTIYGDFKGFLQGFYSPQSVKDIKQIMKTNKPDVVVIHNLYPYISPAVLKHIKKAGVPIVMTIHNYRLMCPTGLFMRNAQPCELCLKGNEWNCIRYNCEHSVIKSLGYAGRNWYARVTKAYSNNVDIFACITAFQTQKLTEAGFCKDRMRVIPNFVDEIAEPTFKLGEYIGISGRISREKGIDLLLEVAHKTPDIKYVFAGAIRPEDKDLLKNAPANCKYLGYLSKNELADFYMNCRFMVIASRWYEGFPMIILDASSYGKATIGPGHAGFLEVIDNKVTGLHFTPGDVNDLQQKIEKLWNASDICIEMGKRAFEKLKENYTANVVEEQWKQVFKIV